MLEAPSEIATTSSEVVDAGELKLGRHFRLQSTPVRTTKFEFQKLESLQRVLARQKAREISEFGDLVTFLSGTTQCFFSN